ncbi:MAG: Hint domain-containing protein [Pelagimonas sp.]|nr:Hint domain-containing protein [Pelagimonas sp.]
MPHRTHSVSSPPLTGALLGYFAGDLDDIGHSLTLRSGAQPITLQLSSGATPTAPDHARGFGLICPNHLTRLQAFDTKGAMFGEGHGDQIADLISKEPESPTLQAAMLMKDDARLGVVLSSAPLQEGRAYPLQERPFSFGSDGAWRWSIPPRLLGISAQAEVQTPSGHKKAGALQIGDLVQTLDHGMQPITWVGKTELSLPELKADFRQWPIHIPPQALGLPGTKPLICDPDQIIALPASLFEHSTAETVRIPAYALLDHPGVTRRAPIKAMSFVHLQMSSYNAPLVNGIPCPPFPLQAAWLQRLTESQSKEVWQVCATEAQSKPPECLPLIEARARLRHLKKRADNATQANASQAVS